jgi:hypothetical protein
MEAVKETEFPKVVLVLSGLTETRTEEPTVTEATACFEASAMLATTTWKVPVVAGAV